MRATPNVWATETRIGRNSIRQLLVPQHGDVRVEDADGQGPRVVTPYGTWPARRGINVGSNETLTATLPVLDSGNGHVRWGGSRAPFSPYEVLDSYKGAIGFTTHDESNSLRRPQIAALHSIVGYQASGLTEPGIVVMPTGTGKTETMLAWLVAERPGKVLVVVPSSALRDQIARKFEHLGILQKFGIVNADARRPCVGRLEHALADEIEAREFVARANVVVATASAIHANRESVREAFYAAFTHLLVDEAHHAPATTWTEIIRAFSGRPVLLFTATPFRRDGRTLPGRVIFRFPLREAQKDNFFSVIDFTSLLDLDDDDEALARAGVERLRSDVSQGLAHILLARVDTKARAEEIHALYVKLAPELNPRVLHDTVSLRQRKEALVSRV